MGLAGIKRRADDPCPMAIAAGGDSRPGASCLATCLARGTDNDGSRFLIILAIATHLAAHV